ncbi:xanthine dehydrogenase small subunit [Paraglaciecola arctica]|uniref:Xanthine dehydrogenase small subunit n=1 Tax=Paraglaciecola arctica BSs20135 TaxID=493475 RepID=K6XAC0_9ALTE|nr:xanthine dehydrogenase small subunit [Paraglaciecola arctica]GAC17579.1 xanthine dehydrogenase small subunit [Paraglaciecola arctica BSs20135]
MISFLLNDEITTIDQARADLTLLEYLREKQKLTGTKEGCASGDCGACTVVLAEVVKHHNSTDNRLEYRAINSCVTFLSALHGKQLITVEHLPDGKELHPVQQSLVEYHGSQCGFCTPGFIMSMFALYQQEQQPDRETVIQALSGNLCRCTGYRPIIDATLSACQNKTSDKFKQSETLTAQRLNDINNQVISTDNLLVPTSRHELAAAKAKYPKANVFAGSTDLALQVTQQLQSFDKLIALGAMPELNQLIEQQHGLLIGAALPFGKIESSLLKHFPQLSELLWRFAATPIRNQASLGGNVANASPIGDMPPALLALNAIIHVDNGQQKRTIAASEFFLDYRKTALKTSEWIESIFIPFTAPTNLVRAYKVSKRYEDDISAVCAVFNAQVVDGKVQKIDCGFGGVAAIPASVPTLNTQLQGKTWSSSESFEIGRDILKQAFSPLDDVRASKTYRLTMLTNLWKRFWLETNQSTQKIETRVVHLPSADAENSHA